MGTQMTQMTRRFPQILKRRDGWGAGGYAHAAASVFSYFLLQRWEMGLHPYASDFSG
jgi:hypothetical protein